MSGGEIRGHCCPVLREEDPRVRRGRLLAARQYAPQSAPRTGILLGHWDRGAIVTAAARQVEDA